MNADRNARQQRGPRRTGGGATFCSLASSAETLAEYAYLGIGGIVQEGYLEFEVRLKDRRPTGADHCKPSGSSYLVGGPAARWYAYGPSADRDRYTYGYDRASNRLYRENTLTTGRDEFYGYDQVNRLIGFQRGELNVNKDGITGTPAREEDWSLDMTGNWPGFVQKTSGTVDLDQDRTHNPVNEITAITATTGTNWADPVHDRNGNMTTIPKPANLAEGLTAIYDAWNRLVEVKDGQTVIARYGYDGLNRRIERHIDSGAPSNPTGIATYIHYYHNSAWQILETRQSDTPSAQPETLQPKHQYVWSQRYIDAPVLRDENTGANGLCDDDRLYYLNDANFNITALLDTSGAAVERYVYSPYGGVTIYDATWTNTRTASSYANVTLYTGRELDAETGLYYYRNRYYGAELGRFAGRDPIGYGARDFNLYRYVRNEPTKRTDPSGLQMWDVRARPPMWRREECCPADNSTNTILDLLEEFADLAGLIQAIADNSTPGVADVFDFLPTPRVSDVTSALEALAQEGGPCNRWYRDALEATVEVDRNYTRAVANCNRLWKVNPVGVNTNYEACFDQLHSATNGRINPFFNQLALRISQECKERVDCIFAERRQQRRGRPLSR